MPSRVRYASLGTVDHAIMADKDDWIQRPVYNATKAGVVGLTKALCTHLAKYGITANAIGPGLFPTEMTYDLLAVKPYMDNFIAKNPSGYLRMGKSVYYVDTENGKDQILDRFIQSSPPSKAATRASKTPCVEFVKRP